MDQSLRPDYSGNQHYIYMTGAEAIRFLLTNENQYFSSNWPPSVKTLLGPNSLAVQAGSQHLMRRKLLAQAFQARALAGYVGTIEQITYCHLQKWVQLGSFAWYPELRDYTLEIACKLIIGSGLEEKPKLGNWFKSFSEGLFTFFFNPLPWSKSSRALRSQNLLLAEIEKTVYQRQQKAELGQDALGRLLQAQDEKGERLSLDELKDQILNLLFAGHETLTSALTSFCLLLTQNPQVLARVIAEQEQLAGSEPLTLEHLNQMSYLEQVLKEVMRLIPPVGGGFRKVIKQCEFNGYSIPKDWHIIYQIGQTHLDTSAYDNPKTFDPDRFDLEREEGRLIPFSYIPFGGGVRECLGKEFAKLEMKIFAALLVRYCKWELLPHQNLELNMVPTPRPKDGLKVKFWLRKE